jgi:hypothetical protein
MSEKNVEIVLDAAVAFNRGDLDKRLRGSVDGPS